MEGQKQTNGQLTPHPHSKTTLVIGKRLVAACGGYQSNVPGEDDQGENEANARRVAACWNACEGIPTEKLEGIASIANAPRNNSVSYWKTRVLLTEGRYAKSQKGLVEALEQIKQIAESPKGNLAPLGSIYDIAHEVLAKPTGQDPKAGAA